MDRQWTRLSVQKCWPWRSCGRRLRDDLTYHEIAEVLNIPRFKDYAFFVPKDCTGRTARIEGVLSVQEIPVEDARATDVARERGSAQELIASADARS